MSLLSSPLIFVALGIFIGAYLSNKPFRTKIHEMIDKYIFKKKKQPEEKPKSKDNTTFND